MLQWILVVFGILGYAYNNFQNRGLTTPQNSVNWLYDQNSGKYYYLAQNGYYYEYQQPLQYQNQVQGQENLGTPYWTQGAQAYGYGQQTQAYAYPSRY